MMDDGNEDDEDVDSREADGADTTKHPADVRAGCQLGRSRYISIDDGDGEDEDDDGEDKDDDGEDEDDDDIRGYLDSGLASSHPIAGLVLLQQKRSSAGEMNTARYYD